MSVQKIEIHPLKLENRKKLFQKRFPKECKPVFEFLRLLSIGEINKGKSVGGVRQRKYLDLLSIFLTKVKKSLSTFTKKDMQVFVEKLQKNEIKKHNKQFYSELTKQDIKVIVRSYLKWRLPKKYAELTDWIDTRVKKKTVEYLSEQEVEKLYNSCKNNSERFLIVLLYDGGFRIEEFLNIRFEDIQEPTEGFPYYKITVKDEYSKTEGRGMGLYWKHSTEVIKDYLAECDDEDLTKQVFPKGYDAVRMFLTRLGKRVLKKRLHCHLLRKSSATFYAPKLNRQQLCIRYGWRFSSDMPDIYIKRAGVEEEEIKEKMFNTNLEKLEKENQEIKTRMGLFKERMEMFEDMVNNIAPSGKMAILNKKGDYTVINHEDQPSKFTKISQKDFEGLIKNKQN